MFAMRKSDPELHERRRAEILLAAETCFTARGFHATSMAEIASAAGLSLGLLYRYFENKDALVLASAARERAEAIAALEALADEPEFIEHLIALLRIEMQESLAPGRARLSAEILAEAARNPALAAHLVVEDGAVRACFANLLRAQQSAGRIAKDFDALVCVDLLLALLDGLAMRAELYQDFSPGAAANLLGDMLRELLRKQT